MEQVRCEFCHQYVERQAYPAHQQQHLQLRPDGQQSEYATLPPEQRQSGPLSNVPTVYVHWRCRTATRMPDEIVRSYLQNPYLYQADETYCAGCKTHVPNRECFWNDSGENLQDYMNRLRSAAAQQVSAAAQQVLTQITEPCCEKCGGPGPVYAVNLHQHIGLILIFFHQHVRGRLCRACIISHYRRFQLVTLLCGWCGVISFFLAPIVLVWNRLQIISLKLGFTEPASAPAQLGALAVSRSAPIPAAVSTGPVQPKQRLLGPAIGLIATASIGVLWAIFWLLIELIAANAPPRPPTGPVRNSEAPIAEASPGTPDPASTPTKKDPSRMPFILWYIEGLVSLLILAGAIQMLRARTYVLAWISCVLGAIPVLAPCCAVSVPFAIWGIVVLCDRQVRQTFS